MTPQRKLKEHIVAWLRSRRYHGSLGRVTSRVRTMADQFVVAIDDDYRVRQSIESLLASADYSPLVFASAEEFLESGMLARTACLILDVRMPGIGGIELQHRIRSDRPLLPIIFISAHWNSQNRQEALGGGALNLLPKPFDAGDLLELIRKALVHE